MRIKLSAIIEDFALYPRGDVDSGHVAHIAAAIESGQQMPDIIIERKSKRIIDGFHRKRAFVRVLGADGEVDVIVKEYPSEADMFLDAMKRNANHGRNLTSYDRTVAINKAVGFAIEPEYIAGALNMTVEKVNGWKVTRCAKLENSGRVVALKQPIKHMAGRTMSKEQAAVVPKIGGNNVMFYVNQIKLLIENDLIDTDNEQLVDGLCSLIPLLKKFESRV